MKKILSMFIAMMLLLTVGVPAVADTKGNSTITIKNNTQNTGIVLKNERYFAYKVMDLNKGTSGTELRYTVDLRFKDFFISKANGVDVSTDEKLNDFANKYFNDNKSNMEAVAADLKKFVDDNNINRDGENGAINTNGYEQSTTIYNVDPGYYIIVDKTYITDNEEEQVIAAAGMGTADNNLEINLKASKPTVDKEIKHNENGNWGVVGDNQIGDNVEYRLTAKLPTNITGYTKYDYVLHDTLDLGLTFNNDVEVYVGEKKDDNSNRLEAGRDYRVEAVTDHNHKDNPYDKTLFDIKINVMEGVKAGSFNLGDTLYIYYSAKLNENAVVAGNSNNNELYLEYSNNPYDENSKEKGPDKIVKDYTFKINALKTDENKTPLEGAEFNIIRDKAALKFKLKTLPEGTNVYVVSTDGTGSETIVSGSNGKYEIIGLDDNVEYTLEETRAPEGFNRIKPIKFTIKTEYDAQGNITSIKTDSEAIQKVDGSFELVTTIVNKKGSLLPETGGVGTALFSLVGGFIMVSALGLFVLNRKKKVS